MSSTIADLVVRINSDVHGLTAGMAKTRSELKRTETSAKQSGKGFSAAGAAMGAGLMAGAAAIGAYAIRSVATYKSLGAQIAGTQRLLGGTAEASSQLVGEIQLVQGTATDASAAFGFFSKNLGLAQQGTGPAAATFKKLNIELKGANGEWRTGTDVVAEFRDKVSGLSNASERAADAAAVMGKGYKTLLPWLSKSGSDIEKLNGQLKDMGFGMDDAEMSKFKKFMGDERLYAVYQEQLQFKMGELVGEIETKLMPTLLQLAGIFNKIPVSVLATGAAIAGIGMAAGSANNILKMLGARPRDIMRVGSAFTRVAHVVPDFISGLRSSRAASSAFTGVAGTLGGKVRGIANGMGRGILAMGTWIKTVPGLIASNIMLIGSFAAVAAGIFFIVDAYNKWRDAANQAAKAAADAQATLDKNAGKLGPEKTAQLQGQINADKYQAPSGVWGWLKAALEGSQSMGNWSPAHFGKGLLGFAGGGIASGPASGYPVMLHGTERVTKMPDVQTGRGSRGGDVTVNVHIGSVVGTDERAARQLSEMVGRHLSRSVMRQMVGQNA